MKFKLTIAERDILYRKYVSEGIDPIDAGKRVKKIKDHIDNLICKLKEKGKTKEEINKRFKKEFEKLCQQNLRNKNN